MRQLFILGALFMGLSVIFPSCKPSGPAAYYVDAERGDDANSGTSPKRAWRSLERAGQQSLQAGEQLLLHRGQTFRGVLEINGIGTAEAPVLVSAYGEGTQPLIQAPDSSLWAVRVLNSDYLTVRSLEIVNTGSERLASRTGIQVECVDFGISHEITLDDLYIHDVNGSMIKRDGGGSGINIVNRGPKVRSRFEGLTITNCHIQRCERNAVIFYGGHFRRDDWYPNLGVVVRGNLIEQVPGDGIVPWGCDGALVEYNIMRDCPDILPSNQAAAGFWPWSSDNTVIQFNEVYEHRAPWDGQSFDSDYNCVGTVIRYNYSHDSFGGMILICDAGDARKTYSIGNDGTRLEYNVSIGDGVRTKPVQGEIFSPVIEIIGNVTHTRLCNNIFHINHRPMTTDHRVGVSDNWGGYADSTLFSHNIFYNADKGGFDLTKSTNNFFEHNWYLGGAQVLPTDARAQTSSAFYQREVLDVDPNGYKALEQLLMDEREVCGVTGHFVNEQKIKDFFEKMQH